MQVVRAAASLALAACMVGEGACGPERDEAPGARAADPPRDRSSPEPPSPSPADAHGPAPRRAAPDIAALAIATPAGWDAEYSAALESWTVKKPGRDAAVAPADRFYVDAFPGDAPTDVDAYAAKLESDPNFQDAGYLFVEIERKETLDGGWLIVGTSKDTSDDESEGSLSFVLLRSAAGVYCHSGTFVDAKSRDEAIEICVGMRER
jgi:hypothetical protein